VRRAFVLAAVAHLSGVAAADPGHPSAQPVRAAAATEPMAAAASEQVLVDRVEPPAVPAEPAVSDGQRLSPRTDIVMASMATTHNAALDVRDLRLKAAAPLVRGDGYGLALLMNYGATWLSYLVGSASEQLTLHRFEAMVGGGAGLADNWSLRGSFGVSHSSDLRDSTWDALQATACMMLHRVVTPSDAVMVGAVYTSAAQLFPVLPLFAYVHQAPGSPFRFDLFLPHHVRAEYALSQRWRSAAGVEAFGDTWSVHMGRAPIQAGREGGTVFGELQLQLTRMLHAEARAGMSVERYSLPMELDGEIHEQRFRPSTFGQFSLVVAP
jgi:hypothetical protein